MNTRLLAVLLLCVTAPALAQEVVLPGFLKFVKVQPGVNIRKQPSTSSPRLMSYYNADDEGGEGDGTWIEWENAKQRRHAKEPVHVGLVPVVNEEGDWYKIFYSSGIRWGGSAFCGYAYVAKRFCTDAELVTVPFLPSPKATNKYKNFRYDVNDGGGDLVPILTRHFDLFNAEMELKDWSQARIENSYGGLTDTQFQHVIPAFSNKVTSIEIMAKDDERPTTIFLEGYKGELRTVKESDVTLTPVSYQKNKSRGEQFLAENLKNLDVKVLPSGVQYKIIKQGTGRRPTPNTKVKLHYEGRYIDGTMFDSTYKRGQTVSFRPNQTITGFRDALINMREGSVWEVYIPQHLGYGEHAAGMMEPFSVIIYKIELIHFEGN